MHSFAERRRLAGAAFDRAWARIIVLALAHLLALGLFVPGTTSAISRDTAGWGPCVDGGTYSECSWLPVPVDHADPASRTIDLLVRRLPAPDPRGVLVTIAGGPGQRGTDGVNPGAHTRAIREAFDIVSWDPRGTSGESLVDCIPRWEPYAGLDRTPDTQEEQARLDDRTRALAAACRQQHGDLLRYMGTLDNALDLERLRQHLGRPRISILASSYGTQVAALYATLFPDRVAAVVLDGYSDPNASPAERDIEQAVALEHELEELLAECALDSACPLTAERQPGATLDLLLEDLDGTPLAAGGGRSLSQSDAYEAIVGSLIRERGARYRLARALAAAVDGDGGPLLDIADDVRQTYEATGLNQGTFMAVVCTDAAGYWQGLSSGQVDEILIRFRQAAPRLGPWLWSSPSADDLPPVGLCAMRADHPSRSTGAIDAAGAGTVLVVASAGDPTTPLGAARRATGDLEQAVLLTVDEDQHLAYPYAVRDPKRPAHRCLLDAVEAYLIGGHAPAAGTVCGDRGST